VNGKNLKIWRADIIEGMHTCSEPGKVYACSEEGIDVRTGSGLLRIVELQMAGRKRMQASQFTNAQDLTGQILGSYSEATLENNVKLATSALESIPGSK